MPNKITAEFLRNSRISNRNVDARLTAIVGLGPTTLNITDEPVVRGTGSVDQLSAYPGSGINVSQIADFPGVNSGALNYVLISQGGVLYNQNSASISNDGEITWSGDPDVDVNIPAAGSVYYVSYQHDVPSSQYDPEEFSDVTDIRAKYGAESNTTGILTTAGSINLENGAPAVLLVQASGSAYNENNYKLAINKLLKRSNIEDLVIVFPTNNSVTRAQQETLITYAMTHIMKSNAVGRERGLIYGSPSLLSAPDGIDTIGDKSTSGTYLYKAFTTTNEDICYIVPSRVRRKDENGNYMELDANFAAAAVAGLQSSLLKRSTPMHEMKISGIEIENNKWEDYELEKLSNGGCLVLISQDNIVSIYDATTTDKTSADTEEKSVIVGKRLVKRTLRDGLRNEFFNGKGTVILPGTETDVEAKAEGLLGGLVRDGELFSYGVIDDPSTGERKITAKVDSSEPRRINLDCSVKFLYPLKNIRITISTFV
ncbi:MAG: hypothetical protein M0R03_16680 [Novosphingobium sp.]|nr:hypothetical protein [Novosphingobium sp.]